MQLTAVRLLEAIFERNRANRPIRVRVYYRYIQLSVAAQWERQLGNICSGAVERQQILADIIGGIAYPYKRSGNTLHIFYRSLRRAKAPFLFGKNTTAENNIFFLALYHVVWHASIHITDTLKWLIISAQEVKFSSESPLLEKMLEIYEEMRYNIQTI